MANPPGFQRDDAKDSGSKPTRSPQRRALFHGGFRGLGVGFEKTFRKVLKVTPKTIGFALRFSLPGEKRNRLAENRVARRDRE
jgi:hypothetical protein